jgi:hypothetical protein
MPLTTAWKENLVRFAMKAVDPLSGVTSVYISLHTADPTVTGDQSSSEATYTGYARVAIARSAVGFSDISLGVANLLAIIFPTNAGSSQTVTYFGIGTASTGAGSLVGYGTINYPSGKLVANGDAPQFDIGDLTVTG